MSRQSNAVATLRQTLATGQFLQMPCCFDALSARLIERAGFPMTFMSGFAVSASRLALPDTNLISYAEMLDEARAICDAVRIPVFGDGDTGYGNVMNVQRTVRGYARAGLAGIMLEDQVSPKRCGHTRGKQVVPRVEAEQRLNAAIAAREEMREEGDDLVIIARTDALATLGMSEAIERACRFHELGAEIIFVEAPRNREELGQIGTQVPGIKMANMLEYGDTPILPPAELEALGYQIAAYPLTLLSSGIAAMTSALQALQNGHSPESMVNFAELQEIVGFPAYDTQLRKFSGPARQDDEQDRPA